MKEKAPSSQLRNDYKKLGNNEFWKYYIEELQRRYVVTCQTLGNASKDSNEMIRVMQGKAQAYRESMTLPSILIKELEKNNIMIRKEAI